MEHVPGQLLFQTKIQIIKQGMVKLWYFYPFFVTEEI